METIDYFCEDDWKGFLQPPRFTVVYSEEVKAFLEVLNEKTRKKILVNINKSKYVSDETLFKKLSGTDFWEFRTLYGKTYYRIYAFWDVQESAVVVTTHGIIKKGNKAPKKELIKADEVRREYYLQKQENKK